MGSSKDPDTFGPPVTPLLTKDEVRAQVGMPPPSDLPSDRASAINRDRQSMYGSPIPNYEQFAAFVSAVLHRKLTAPVSASEAGHIMICLKQMRDISQPGVVQDNLDDICGFANVIDRIHKGADFGP